MFFRTELDLCEKVISGARDPRFGNKTTSLECVRVVVQKVGDVVEDFWWEAWIRHRGGDQGAHPGAGLVLFSVRPTNATRRPLDFLPSRVNVRFGHQLTTAWDRRGEFERNGC